MACISMSRINGHKCVERATDADCPICGEYLFSSPRPVTLMQCGHSIHAHCFEELQKTSYRCPLCNKSLLNMEYRFRQLDIQILHQPMPPDYANARAVITCNDCHAKSETPYHWIGLKCAVCGSYNTNQLQLLNMPGGDPSGEGQADRPRYEPVSLDPAIVAEEMRRRIRESRRATSRRRGSDSGSGGIPGLSLLSTSPSSAAGKEAVSVEGVEKPAGGVDEKPGTCGAATAARNLTGNVVDDDEEDEEDEEDMLDLFGTSYRDFDRMTGLTSAESAVGFDDDDDEEEEEESSDEEEDDVEEEDEEDEEDDILLVGHR
jgi:hypothetical protein